MQTIDMKAPINSNWQKSSKLCFLDSVAQLRVVLLYSFKKFNNSCFIKFSMGLFLT